LRTLTGHNNAVWAAAFSPDSRYIISGSANNDIKVWDAESFSEVHTITGLLGTAASLSYTSDGKRILAGVADGTVRLYNAETFTEVAEFICFKGDDARLAAGGRGITTLDTEQLNSVTGEWITVTPDGYYTASPRGDRYLNVLADRNLSGIDSYRSVFYNPDVVRSRLTGRVDPASIILGIFRTG
jgi:WD40 repeat protein